MDEFYLNVLRARIDPTHPRYFLQMNHLFHLFTRLSPQEFPYEESTCQNQMTFIEVNEYSEIQSLP